MAVVSLTINVNSSIITVNNIFFNLFILYVICDTFQVVEAVFFCVFIVAEHIPNPQMSFTISLILASGIFCFLMTYNFSILPALTTVFAVMELISNNFVRVTHSSLVYTLDVLPVKKLSTHITS